MMEIIPAIDLIDGQCQRLKQGDFEESRSYSWDPVELASLLEQKGFSRLHLVDLQGAGENKLVHLDILKSVMRSTGLAVDYGGGIRTEQDVKQIVEAGAQYVTLGSLAVSNPALVSQWMRTFGNHRFILAADIRNGQVVTNAWRDESGIPVNELIESFVREGLGEVLCTDISRDGMLRGVNLEIYQRLRKAFPSLRIIASGGVTTLEDIRNLDRLGIDAAVVGKALFEGKLDMDALAAWNKGELPFDE